MRITGTSDAIARCSSLRGRTFSPSFRPTLKRSNGDHRRVGQEAGDRLEPAVEAGTAPLGEAVLSDRPARRGELSRIEEDTESRGVDLYPRGVNRGDGPGPEIGDGTRDAGAVRRDGD